MTTNKISFALFPVLKKKTKLFTGGRITDIDLLTLDEAAKMATIHAGCEVTPQDFLRAAGRGEIELIAVVKKDTKFKYLDEPELEPWITKGGGWRIPLNACRTLASKGFAQWRTQEEVKVHRGNFMKYCPTLQIADDEPDLEADPSDCRVLGQHIHALADAFISQTAAESHDGSEPVPTVADSASSALARARRDLLVPVIEAAQKECKDPFDTPAVWASLSQMAQAGKRPLVGVTDDGLKWFDTNDEPKFLTRKNLGERLRRMKNKAR